MNILTILKLFKFKLINIYGDILIMPYWKLMETIIRPETSAFPSWQSDVSYVDESNVCTLGAPVSNGADGANGTGGIVNTCGAHLAH